VVHTDAGRRRGKSRPRILYWFRTPPGVRVGRSALDESAIRLIEEHNPEVEFDWTRILKGQDAPVEQKAFPQQERRGRPKPRQFGSRPAPVAAKSTDDPPAAIEAVGQSDDPSLVAAPAERFAVHDTGNAPVDLPAFDDLLPGRVAAEAMPTSENPPPNTPAEARLGSEGLSRLRARHAEVLARISEAVVEPIRREELKSQAERLNPDTWVTDAEVTEGLESYETVFESLRTVVGRRGRRRRRSAQRPHAVPAGQEAIDTEADSVGAADSDSAADDSGGDR
jgi:hypothetical protein